MTAPHTPRLGVMSHSFCKELFVGQSIDECFRSVAALGSDQHIEIIGGQLLRSYPFLSDGEAESMRRRIDENGLQRAAYCSYVERGRRTGKTASDEEALIFVRAELDIAYRLGFRIVRLNPPTSNMVLSLLPDLERLGMTLAVELHSESLESPAVQALLKLCDEQRSELLGFLQDMGAYTLRVPDVYIDYGIRTGVPEPLVRLVVNDWNQSRPLSDTLAELASQPYGAQAIDYARVCSSVYVHGSLDKLNVVLPHLKYVHSKLYGMNEAEEEPAIPYREIIGMLVSHGYDGIISSEYGGGLFSRTPDCFAQLTRQQAMIRRLWDEAVLASDKAASPTH